MANLLDLMKTAPPDVAWLLKVVSKFCPDDEIFKKNYKYVKPKPIALVPNFSNDDGLFNDLPLLTEGEIRKTNRLRVPKATRIEL